MEQVHDGGDVGGGGADVGAGAAGGQPVADTSDAALIVSLRIRGLNVAADRLELYAGMAPHQRRLSEDTQAAGLELAAHMAYEGIPFTAMTCDDAVAVAALMAMHAKHVSDEKRDRDAMPRLILPGRLS